jgi:2,3-bisphosphoglycerate-independent phosphoglycerate mutase
MTRILFFIIDGFADKPQKITPLRLAKKEFLEKLLKEKSLSLYRFLPLEKNYWPKLGQRSVTGLANLGILG